MPKQIKERFTCDDFNGGHNYDIGNKKLQRGTITLGACHTMTVRLVWQQFMHPTSLQKMNMLQNSIRNLGLFCVIVEKLKRN